MHRYHYDTSTILDSEKYEDPDAKVFATIAACEIEAERIRRGGANRHHTKNALIGLLGIPVGEQLSIADITPWFEYLSYLEVIDKISIRVATKRTETVTSILDLIQPPNWQTFFWLRAYLEQIESTVPIAKIDDYVNSALAARARHAAKLAGQASGRSRKISAVDAVAVQAEAARLLAAGHKPHKIAGIVADSFHVTPERIRQILRK